MKTPSQGSETEREIIPATESMIHELAALAAYAIDVRIRTVFEVYHVFETVSVHILPDMAGEIAIQLCPEGIDPHMLRHGTNHELQNRTHRQGRHVAASGFRHDDPRPLIRDLAFDIPEGGSASFSESIQDASDDLPILAGIQT